MKDRIFVSIVDESGSKQFNLHKIAKKVFVLTLIGVFVVLASGFFLMSYLMKQVQEIELGKTAMIENYKKTYAQNQLLKEQIRNKSDELLKVNKKVDDLEEIISISRNADKPLEEKSMVLEFDEEQKKMILHLLPNGNPVQKYKKITSIKERIHPLKNIYGVKSGIDYIVSLKTPVYATADGIIDLSKNSSNSKGYGKFIKITHAYGFSSMYAHLSEVLVKKGDFVQKGELIGYSGNTGNSNGARLYYEVRFLGGYQDALTYARWGEKNFESIFEIQEHINWNKLLWAIDDLKQLRNYRLSYQDE